MGMAQTFTRAERLSGKARYDLVFQEGKAFRCRWCTVLARPNAQEVSRLGLSVGRKLGGAVRRNRIKRLFREAFRLNKDVLAVPCDFVVIPRRDLGDVSLGDIEQGFRKILQDAGKTFAG